MAKIKKAVEIKHGKKQGGCHVMTPKEYGAHTKAQKSSK